MFIVKSGNDGNLHGKIIDAECLDDAVRIFVLSDTYEQQFITTLISDGEFNMNSQTPGCVIELSEKCDAVNDQDSYMQFITDNVETIVGFLKTQANHMFGTFAIIEGDPVGVSAIKSACKT